MPWLHFRITNQIRFLEIAILCNKEFVRNDRLVTYRVQNVRNQCLHNPTFANLADIS